MIDLESIQPDVGICCVIGNPIGHSLSPAIHNAAFQELNLNYTYVACLVTDVKAALDQMRSIDRFRGMSITIPHKIEAMKHVDEVAEVDRSIGCINTVIHEGDKLLGFSTDGPGALKALTDSDVSVDGKNILMLGSGGAARAIAFTLARKTQFKELTLLDIDEKMLRQLTADLTAGTKAAIRSELTTDASLAAAMAKVDVIIHCTPIGMHPGEDAALIPAELFRPNQVVFDIVYTPLETKLLKEAKKKGLKVISGVEMFINQAALQFERFSGKDAPLDVMRKVVLEHLRK